MPGARKTFDAPFVLEKSKLTRLLEVTQERFSQASAKSKFHFQTLLANGKTTQHEAVEQVLSLENSKKTPIRSVWITCSEDGEPADIAVGKLVSIEFDGGSPAHA